jgi:hypothetical protein
MLFFEDAGVRRSAPTPTAEISLELRTDVAAL